LIFQKAEVLNFLKNLRISKPVAKVANIFVTTFFSYSKTHEKGDFDKISGKSKKKFVGSKKRITFVALFYRKLSINFKNQ